MLLIGEGFDAVDDWGGESGYYDYFNSSNIFSANYGRREGSQGVYYSPNNTSTQRILETVIPARQALVFAAAYNFRDYGFYSINSAVNTFFQLLRGEVPVLTVQGDSTQVTGRLVVRRGDYNGTILGYTETNLNLSGWTHLAVKVTVSPTTGAVEVRFDNVPVLVLSGINTDAVGDSLVDRFMLGNPYGRAYIDDFYLLDDTGAVGNDFLGDALVDAYFPTADGTYADFARSAGSDSWSLVDELVPDTTDYVEGTALDQRMTTKVTVPDAGQTVHGVMVHHVASNPAGGVRAVKSLIKTGAVETLGAELSLTVSDKTSRLALSVNPDTSAAFTVAELNAAEFGVRVTV